MNRFLQPGAGGAARVFERLARPRRVPALPAAVPLAAPARRRAWPGLLLAAALAAPVALLPAPALAQAVTGVAGGNGGSPFGGDGGASGDGGAAGGLGSPVGSGPGDAGGAGSSINLPANSGTLQGGNGGSGASSGGGGGAGVGGGGAGGMGGGFGGGGGGAGTGGGGGGGGGYGFGAGGAGGGVTGAVTLTNANGGKIAGGNGGSGDSAAHGGSGGDGIGNGGDSHDNAGSGSSGGGPIIGAITLNNQAGGVVQGGNGAGSSPGGVGVRGTNVTIVNDGTIEGGTNGDGTQADAIVFTGGTNSLELWRDSYIIGNVVAVPNGSDTLILGGSVDSDIHLDDIGAGQQYQNFANFEKTGTSGWTLNGTTTEAMAWNVKAGTLVLGHGSSMDAASSVTVASSATLYVMDTYTLQSLANSGTTILEGAVTVGAYTGGSGSALDIPAQLNAGTALAQLTVTNSVNNVTAVNIINFDPSVALTAGNGIPLVTLPAGAPAGSFVLGNVTDLAMNPITGYDFKLTQVGNALFLQILAQGAASTTAVPTLNPWALALLALLLAGGAALRRQRGR